MIQSQLCNLDPRSAVRFKRHGLVFRIGLTFQGKSGLVLLDQVHTLDKARLAKRLGAVHPATLQKLLTTLQSVFAPG